MATERMEHAAESGADEARGPSPVSLTPTRPEHSDSLRSSPDTGHPLSCLSLPRLILEVYAAPPRTLTQPRWSGKTSFCLDPAVGSTPSTPPATPLPWGGLGGLTLGCQLPSTPSLGSEKPSGLHGPLQPSLPFPMHSQWPSSQGCPEVGSSACKTEVATHLGLHHTK